MAETKTSEVAIEILRTALEREDFPTEGLRYEVAGPSVNARRGNKVVALLAGTTLVLDWEK